MTQAEQHQLADEKDIETYFLARSSPAATMPTPRPTASRTGRTCTTVTVRALKTRLKIPISSTGGRRARAQQRGGPSSSAQHRPGRHPQWAAGGGVSPGSRPAGAGHGVQWTFRTCVAVVPGRALGTDLRELRGGPALVAERGEAPSGGLQGRGPEGAVARAGRAKHYVGDGARPGHGHALGRWLRAGGSHWTRATCAQRGELRRIHLRDT